MATDRKEREIEALCMQILLQQQPVAGDFRAVSSALKMISDMERIGDQTDNIGSLPPISPNAVPRIRYRSARWPGRRCRWSPTAWKHL